MDLTELAKGYYRAYGRHDPDWVAARLAPGFTFTSPFDEHIDEGAYFRRCWPKTALHHKFTFIAVAQDGDRVLVVYDAELKRPNAAHPEMRFRNAEMLTFADGRLKSVDVFFGDPPGGLTRHAFAVQSGMG
jgi:ketosteroid isomerase-like protein